MNTKIKNIVRVLTQLGIPTGPANPAAIADNIVRNNEQALLFFNTTTGSLQIWAGGAWIDTAGSAASGASTNYVTGEVPTGAINGTNKAYVLSKNIKTGTEMVFVDGALLPKAGYTITTGKNIAITGAAPVSSVLVTYFSA